MTPPRLAEALIVRGVPDDAVGLSVVGDLRLEFADRCARHGALRARAWYWSQAWSIWYWSALHHPSHSHHSPRGGVLFDLVGDIRHAWRVVQKAPGQTLLIAATLGVGIGLTTIGFSFADTVLLRGMPIADPANIVRIFAIDARQPERRAAVYASDYLEFRDRVQSLEDLCAFAPARVTLRRGDGDVTRITIGNVTGDLFRLWGLRTQLGRGLHSGDHRAGAPPVAVLTDRFWRDAFNRSPEAIGDVVTVDGVSREIVGVMTRDVEFANFAELALWVPAALEPRDGRDLHGVLVTGRLAPGARVENADAEVRVLAQAIADAQPATNRGRQALVLPVTRALGGPNLLLVMTLLVGTAALVTVVAGVNVAGVLLARAVVRQREFAMRVALGAQKSRVFRQLAAEGVLVAALGGAAGVAVAAAGLRLIRSIDAEPIFQQIVIDWHEGVFVAVLALVSPLVFSLAPALAAVRLDLLGTLSANSTRLAGASRRGREWLVAAQLGLAIALAVVGGLVGRTASELASRPSGFNSSNVVTFVMHLEAQPHDGRSPRQLRRALTDRLATEAVAVGVVDALPGVAMESPTSIRPDVVAPLDGQTDPWAHVVGIDERALATLGIEVASGRTFTAHEVDAGAAVALVSLETARKYFGSAATAVGRRLAIDRAATTTVYEVVGVTADARNTDLEHGMPPRVWVPLSAGGPVTIAIRTDGDTQTVAEQIRRVARDVAPEVPVEALETYDRAIARRTGGDRVAIGMVIAFAIAAIMFAVTGLYGIVAFSANMRRSEFATRFALGAQMADVAGLVVRQALRLLAIGLAIGLAAGIAVGSAMRQLLFGVSPLDPLNLLLVVGLLTIVTLAASIAPAVRASRIDVIQAIRAE